MLVRGNSHSVLKNLLMNRVLQSVNSGVDITYRIIQLFISNDAMRNIVFIDVATTISFRITLR